MPSVFISYSHDSPEHADRVLALANRLVDEGIDVILDQYEPAPPEGWPRWMDKKIRDANFVLMVCTETYYRRVMGEEKAGTGLGVKWEGNLIYQHIYNADTTNSRFIPILFEYCIVEQIPTPVGGSTRYHVDSPDGYEDLYRHITNQPRTIKPKLGTLKSLPPRTRKDDYLGIKISLAKLPSTDPTLFGRDDYLKQLDDAWQLPITNPQLPKINILSLVAWGGVGKTALVNRWLSQMGRDNYRGAERVYGWSFYSQGAAEGRQVSADQFIAAALTWFGDPDPTQGSPWDKGERLAELIKAQRTLLILDGLEPLQNPPPVETGKIKDPGLTSLLRELASQNPGLVVISTRLAVDDLKDFKDSSTKEIDLDSLSDESGAAYLKYLGVDGTDEERQAAAKDFGGHALALTLLGRYLKVVHNGDIRKHGEIPHVMDEQKQGAHARRVMESYERWLQGKPELDILRLMGLFDRPAEKGALDALRKEPAIPGLTDALQKLSDIKWKYAVNDLRELRLLAPEDPHEPDTLDCHPLLREHFGEKLKTENIKGWQEAHGRLYEYYKSAAKEFPDTLEEMAPLYAAVMHGCQAGRYVEAISNVFYQRMTRKDEAFIIKKLGAFNLTLSLYAGFFDSLWNQLVPGLPDGLRGYILSNAGFCQKSLGRQAEGIQLMKVALEEEIDKKRWERCAAIANNVSESYVNIGDLKQALFYARQGVIWASDSKDFYQLSVNRVELADVLQQLGETMESGAVFHGAEDLQKRIFPNRPILDSWQGYRYSDFMLAQGNHEEVINRGQQWLRLIEEKVLDDLFTVGLTHLALGRAYQIQPQLESNFPFSESEKYLNQAVETLRQLGTQEFVVRALLARAEYYSVTGDLDKSQKDLDEAFTIATRGGMGLHLADCHLEYARLYLAKGEKAKARENWVIAKEKIEKMGYHRRDKEVQELEEQLK